MQCERCGSEQHDVWKTERCRTAAGSRHPHSDRRHYQCRECGQVSIVECRLTLIQVFDPATHKKKLVSVDEYRQGWRDVEYVKRNQLRIFDAE